jgi:hypothetical protein
MDYNMPVSPPDLNSLNFFLQEYLKMRSMTVQWALEGHCGIRFNNLQVKQLESLIASKFVFLYRDKLIAHEHDDHFEHLLYESKNIDVNV